MALATMKEMLIKAKDNKYAVGQFNMNNLEWAQAILETAGELKSPVILGVSVGAAKYMGGFKTVVNIVSGLIEENGYNDIPVAIHLDHGPNFELCQKAYQAGFTSIMIDGSHLPLDENIAIVKKVVDYIATQDRFASVEAELGIVGGEEDGRIGEGVIYADPQECKKLVDKTNIDCLAPALGSVHGHYQGEPNLGFDEMLQVKELCDLPLVLHGGSGIPDDQIKKAIERGTSKINVNTECQVAFTAAVKNFFEINNIDFDPRKVLKPGKDAIKAVVKEKILLFGSNDKA